jgi:hypothetical protein
MANEQALKGFRHHRRIPPAEKESAAYGNDSLSGTLYEGDAVPLPLRIFCGETRDDEHASAH